MLRKFSGILISSTIALAYVISLPEKILSSPYKNKNFAVVDFAGKNISSSDSSIISDFIRTELVNIGKYNIMERKNMLAILAEQKFQMSGCTEQDCAVKMGKLLNVEKMIIGTVSKLDGIYFITASIVDVETGKIEMSKVTKCESANYVISAGRNLARQLCGMESRKTTPERSENAEQKKNVIIDKSPIGSFIDTAIVDNESFGWLDIGYLDGAEPKDVLDICIFEEEKSPITGKNEICGIKSIGELKIIYAEERNSLAKVISLEKIFLLPVDSKKLFAMYPFWTPKYIKASYEPQNKLQPGEITEIQGETAIVNMGIHNYVHKRDIFDVIRPKAISKSPISGLEVPLKNEKLGEFEITHGENAVSIGKLSGDRINEIKKGDRIKYKYSTARRFGINFMGGRYSASVAPVSYEIVNTYINNDGFRDYVTVSTEPATNNISWNGVSDFPISIFYERNLYYWGYKLTLMPNVINTFSGKTKVSGSGYSILGTFLFSPSNWFALGTGMNVFFGEIKSTVSVLSSRNYDGRAQDMTQTEQYRDIASTISGPLTGWHINCVFRLLPRYDFSILLNITFASYFGSDNVNYLNYNEGLSIGLTRNW